MTPLPERPSRHLNITGSVQGVGFRYYLQRLARELGVTGWVRNRGDGSVEAVICGEAEALDKVIVWARQGPPAAAVASVEVLDVSDTAGYFSGFETLPSE